jgi:DNA polymerase III alpha subunit
MATIDHKEAEDRGFFKLDILNLSLYKDIKTPDQLDELMQIEPQWDLLTHNEFTDMLFHVNGHGDILRKLKPTNITQLAAVLAIIRPAKRHLVDSDWDTIMKQVWIPPTDGTYYFKKSHAIAYAHVVVVQMNQLVATLT